METLSITAEDGTVYEFEKPDFDCELLKVYENKKIVGSACDASFGHELQPFIWNINGIVISRDSRIYDITPIKKPWYENEDNFPALLIWNDYDRVVYNKNEAINNLEKNWRLATKEEVEALYYDNKDSN